MAYGNLLLVATHGTALAFLEAAYRNRRDERRRRSYVLLALSVETLVSVLSPFLILPYLVLVVSALVFWARCGVREPMSPAAGTYFRLLVTFGLQMACVMWRFLVPSWIPRFLEHAFAVP